MNGPAHYLEAERILRLRSEALLAIEALGADVLADPDLDDGDREEIARYADEQLFERAREMDSMLAEAQVHATLALTAAQAGVLMREYVEGEDDATAWVKATQT